VPWNIEPGFGAGSGTCGVGLGAGDGAGAGADVGSVLDLGVGVEELIFLPQCSHLKYQKLTSPPAMAFYRLP